MYKTPHKSFSDANRAWHVIDAKEQTLGKVATKAAALLIGKHKADLSFNADSGDHVVVINAKFIEVSGKKAAQKKYYHHGDHMGGLTTTSFEDMIDTNPTKVIRLAVQGMLPRTHLGAKMINRLKIYANDQHPHNQAII
jgi:large subunit ribosomal protein L13